MAVTRTITIDTFRRVLATENISKDISVPVEVVRDEETDTNYARFSFRGIHHNFKVVDLYDLAGILAKEPPTGGI